MHKRGAEFFAIVPENSKKPSRMQIQVKWIKPGQGWIKPNTDGAVFGDPRKADGGGLLCNSEGNWIAGFTRKLRLHLVRVKVFPENRYFPKMLFSRKENVFMCLVAFQKMFLKIFSDIWLCS